MTVSLAKQKRDQEQPFYLEEDKWYVRPDQVFEAETIIEFMNKRLVTSVTLQLPFSTIFIRNLIFFAIVLIALVMVKRSYAVLVQPWTWYVLSMLVFFICTGGVMHTVIHQTPWFKFGVNEYGQQEVVEYFMRGQRGQWAGEGYIVSSLTTLGAICATIVGVVHKF